MIDWSGDGSDCESAGEGWPSGAEASVALTALALPSPNCDATEPKNVGKGVGEMDHRQLNTLAIESAGENCAGGP